MTNVNQQLETHSEEPTPTATPADQLGGLVSAIIEGRSVCYVGSGASVPSGLPTWQGLLEELVENARELLTHDKESLAYIEGRIKKGDLMEAADLLQDLFDTDLHSHLGRIIQRATGPSSIHANIARIPFKIAMTTNFDRLLEKAYPMIERPVLTWERSRDLLRGLQSNQDLILKLHGEIGQSLILSTRQYRTLMHGNPLFRDLFTWIFMTKTCIFVGAGLTDLDVLQTLHRSIVGLADDFGPHYALIPEHEAPPLRVSNLLQNLRIRTIPIVVPNCDPNHPSLTPQDSGYWGLLTDQVSKVLVDLGGKVAAATVHRHPPPLPNSDDPAFHLDDALDSLLQQAIRVTGSFRADVCLSSDGIGSHLSGELKYKHSRGLTNPNVIGRSVDGLSICGIAYYSSEGGVYVPDVWLTKGGPEDASNPPYFYIRPSRKDKLKDRWDRLLPGPLEAKYFEGHSDVRSELAIPITAEGVRVGVLNLESDQRHAYSDGHFAAARWFADKAGRLFTGALERERRGRRFGNIDILGIYPELCQMFEQCAALGSSRQSGAEIDLSFLAYHVNYSDGRLVAQNVPELEHNPEYKFSDESLASRVFRSRCAILCSDAVQAAERKEIPNKYLVSLKIVGPLLGFVVSVHGYISGVVVIWAREGKGRELLTWRTMELLQRTAHAIANSGRRPNSDLTQDVDKWNAEQGDKRLRQAYVEERRNQALANMKEVKQVLDIFSATPPPQSTSGGLNTRAGFGSKELFRHWSTAVHSLAEVLKLLMNSYGEYENDFLVPKRARLWIRSVAPGGQPRCCLVAEVSIARKKSDPTQWQVKYRNGFGTKVQLRVAVPGQHHETGKTAKVKWEENISLKNFGLDTSGHAPCEVVSEDQFLAFHLARINADRFARLQWPAVLGPDKNCDDLEKNPNQPWYVAPIIGVLEEPRHLGPEEKRSAAFSVQEPVGDLIDVEHSTLRLFLGYITLDDGRNSTRNFERQTCDFAEAALQNDLLHKLDLFTACVAETPVFRSFLNLVRKTGTAEAGTEQSEGAPKDDPSAQHPN